MTVSIRVDEDKRFLVVIVEGQISIDEFRETMASIAQSDAYPPNVNALWDLRELDLREIDDSFWRGVLGVRKRFPERSNARLAHVVDGDYAFGMLRMYQILSSLDEPALPQQVQVFKQYSDAEQWLLSPSDTT